MTALEANDLPTVPQLRPAIRQALGLEQTVHLLAHKSSVTR